MRQHLPDNVAAKEVPLQQEVVHERHDQQQRCKAAGNEGDKVAQLGQARRGKLLQEFLSCLVAGVQPAHAIGQGPLEAALWLECNVCMQLVQVEAAKQSRRDDSVETHVAAD